MPRKSGLEVCAEFSLVTLPWLDSGFDFYLCTCSVYKDLYSIICHSHVTMDFIIIAFMTALQVSKLLAVWATTIRTTWKIWLPALIIKNHYQRPLFWKPRKRRNKIKGEEGRWEKTCILNTYCSNLLNSYLVLQVLCLWEHYKSAFFLSFPPLPLWEKGSNEGNERVHLSAIFT